MRHLEGEQQILPVVPGSQGCCCTGDAAVPGMLMLIQALPGPGEVQ